MKIRRWLTASLFGLGLALVVGPAQALALVGAPLDGNAHPSVGHIFGQLSDPSTCEAQVIAGCTATLISPTVAVTSGNCADSFANAADYGYDLTATWISFNGGDPFDCATASRVGAFHIHPQFVETNVGDPFDIGVLILAAPATATPATLPAAGSQDSLVRGDALDSAGWAQDDNGNYLTARRRIGALGFRSSDDDYLTGHLTLSGNVCATSFDGGAAFLPGGQDLAGLDNGVKSGCKNGRFLRLDTPAARDFLDDFVTVP